MPETRYRWVVVAILFLFMLLHQTDRLMIGSLATPIIRDFGIDEEAFGRVGTAALLLATALFPLWGFLFDRFARTRLIALASAISGVTTWFGAIAPTYPAFLAARASTGIDDSTYPGLFSLVSDYFGPALRGRVLGLLQLSQPLGYMIGMSLALLLGNVVGWRNLFFFTGTIGIVLAILIYLRVREVPRGRSEPELMALNESAIGNYRFSLRQVRGLLARRALIPLWLQGFFGIFPWSIITFWIFRYLENERAYAQGDILLNVALAVVALSLGNVVGGTLGDTLSRRTPRGRMLVALSGVFGGAIALLLTFSVPFQTETGPGLNVGAATDGGYVLSPQPGRAAQRAGIVEGDVLVAIDGAAISGGSEITPADLAARLGVGGEPAQVVELTVRSGPSDEERVVPVILETVNVTEQSGRLAFLFLLCVTAFLIPFSGPNIIATVHEITVPEARSTALSVQYFIENAGGAFAPWIVGTMAVQGSLGNAILTICFVTWMIAGVFLLGAAIRIPRDIASLRAEMADRANEITASEPETQPAAAS